MATMRENKQAIRKFMRENYTDERLAMLLAHAQSGRLAFDSCCCFIGIPSAPHALAGAGERAQPEPLHHRIYGNKLPDGSRAEWAYAELGGPSCHEPTRDIVRRRKIIPMIRAEMRRRERDAASVSAEFAAEVEARR
jgi:hypothetical protein